MAETHSTPHSSQVTHTMYDGAPKFELTVYYKKGVYRYLGVQPDVWEKYKKAESVGKFLNDEIKPNYQYVKIS